MAKLIKFYVPDRFRPRATEDPAEPRGKVIEFRPNNADANDPGGCEHPGTQTLQTKRTALVDVPRR